MDGWIDICSIWNQLVEWKKMEFSFDMLKLYLCFTLKPCFLSCTHIWLFMSFVQKSISWATLCLLYFVSWIILCTVSLNTNLILDQVLLITSVTFFLYEMHRNPPANRNTARVMEGTLYLNKLPWQVPSSGAGDGKFHNNTQFKVIILCSILRPTFPRSTWPPPIPHRLSPAALVQVLAVGQSGLRVRGSQLCKCFQLLCDCNGVLLFDQAPTQAGPWLFLAAAGDKRMSARL